MNTATNRLPISQRPTLRLKFGSTPVPAPHVISPPGANSQTAVSAIVTASQGEPAVAEIVVTPEKAKAPATVKPPGLNAVEIAGRARRVERWAAIDAEKTAAAERAAEKAALIAKRVAAHELGKQEMHQRAMKMQETLAERFPDCFQVSGPRLPLKVGVDRDVINAAPDLNEGEIKWAIKLYVRDPAYLQAMVEGVDRVDLDGSPSGTVTRNEARWAAICAARGQVAPGG
jgi:hypothetical protein